MHDDRKPVEDRITRYLSPALITTRAALTVSAWHAPGEPTPVADPGDGYQPFSIGETWGGPWSTTWTQSSRQIPAGPAWSSVPSQSHDGALDPAPWPFRIPAARHTASTSNA
ncbi:hypothetical protein [Streptacidiphilus sp. EB103A]|uniref:hypothetical protein n=1 Tax=Streptacidiphilus sp. EB103A TaxID=3156275 RepID=UPI0035130433